MGPELVVLALPLLQAFRSIDSLNPLVIDMHAALPEFVRQHPIAVAGVLGRQFPQAIP